MKKFLKIFVITLLTLFIILLAAPYLFRKQIMEAAKEQASKNLQAKVDFGGISLSLIRNFPNVSLRITNLSVAGVGAFEGDTLARIGRIGINLDLFSAIRGNTYEIKSIQILRPVILLKVLPDSSANWDIAPASPPEDTAAQAGSFVLKMKDIRIEDASFVYDDRLLNTRVAARGLNSRISGDMTAETTMLSTLSTLADLTLDYGGVRYLNRAELEARADVDANLKEMIFVLKDNEFRLNHLVLGLDGSVGMLQDGYDLDLTFKSRQTDFKTLLSLIPALYAKDFEKLTASGTMAFEGSVKGIYSPASMPGYDVRIQADNGRFQYPGLPAAIENVGLAVRIASPGGDPDNTVVDLSRFHLEMAGTPVNMTLLLKTPVSDPWLRASVNGKLNLADVKKFYPVEQDLSGRVEAALSMEGRTSALEKGNYDDFKADGSLSLFDFKVPGANEGQIVHISSALLKFSPAFLELAGLDLKIGQNDFSASGKITNYLGYALKNQDLKGNLSTRSSYFNLNDFMTTTSAEGKPQSDTAAMGVFRVPERIDFTLASTFEHLIYDKLDMRDVKGTLKVKDRQVQLENLSLRALGGSMAVSGNYDTREDKPKAGFRLNLKQVDIGQTAAAFVTVKTIAPVVEKLTGSYSADLNLNTALGADMMPDLNTLQSAGSIESGNLKLAGVTALQKLDDILKLNRFNNMDLQPVKLSYVVQDGKLSVKPFDLKAGNLSATFGGAALLASQELDLDFIMKLPRSEFGGAANNALNSLVSQASQKGINVNPGETVSILAKITGSASNPKVSADLGQMAGGVAADLKKQAEEEFNRQKAELEAKAKAELDAQKKAAEDKLKQEADKKKKELEEKAKRQADSLKKKGEDELKKKLKKFF